MTWRKDFVVKICRKLGRRFRKKPVRLQSASASPAPVRKDAPGIEPLEGRIAPATLVNPSTLTFQDFDGDLVTVKFSKPIFANSANPRAAAEAVFEFNDAIGVNGSNEVPQDLELIDLTAAPIRGISNVAMGVSVSVTAKTSLGATSTVDVGAIDARGVPLGAVTIAGDLGKIEAGNGTAAIGLKSLTVESLGKQTGAGIESQVRGGVGALNVATDISEAFFRVLNGLNASGKIGRVNIGGTLIGLVDPQNVGEPNYDNWGSIQTAGSIGSIRIGAANSSLGDGILGGSGGKSGAIISGGSIGNVVVDGGVQLGGGLNAGAIVAAGSIGAVSITGALIGGSGIQSGIVSSGGDIGSIKIGGHVAGGSGVNSGGIHAGGAIGGISIGDDLLAGKGAGSGVVSSASSIRSVSIVNDIDGSLLDGGSGTAGISAGGRLGSVTIGGNLIGGSASFSGFIEGKADVGDVKIGSDVKGGAGTNSGVVFSAGKLDAVTIAGRLEGGDGINSGSIFSSTDPFVAHQLGEVIIGTAVIGGTKMNSGSIIAGGDILRVTIGDAGPGPVALKGGAAEYSGSIFAAGGIRAAQLNGGVEGGAQAHAGSIEATGKLTSLHVIGVVTGGDGDFSGAIISRTGAVQGDLGVVSISGSLTGGAGANSGIIQADGSLFRATLGSLVAGPGSHSGGILTGADPEADGSVGTIEIHGDLIGDIASNAGRIEVQGRLGSLSVDGAVTGATVRVADDLGSFSAASLNNTVISARGQALQSRAADVAIAKIEAGTVLNSQILAGYDVNGAPVNPDAQIGNVKINGDWVASSIVAGVADAAGDGFGNSDDVAIPGGDNARIFSRIANVIIAGTVSGTSAPNDHFGFVARQIGAFQAGSIKLALDGAANEQVFPLSPATGGDVAVREVPLVIT